MGKFGSTSSRCKSSYFPLSNIACVERIVGIHPPCSHFWYQVQREKATMLRKWKVKNNEEHFTNSHKSQTFHFIQLSEDLSSPCLLRNYAAATGVGALKIRVSSYRKKRDSENYDVYRLWDMLSKKCKEQSILQPRGD